MTTNTDIHELLQSRIAVERAEVGRPRAVSWALFTASLVPLVALLSLVFLLPNAPRVP